MIPSDHAGKPFPPSKCTCRLVLVADGHGLMRPELRRWLDAAVALPFHRHEPLPVEASHRRFYRVHVGEVEPSAGERKGAPLSGEGASAEKRKVVPRPRLNVDASFVVMESPPSLERNEDFVAMQRLFAAAGLPVPEILAMDLDAGFFLLTDLGERSLEDAYRGPHQDLALELAVTHLARLQGIAPVGVPAYEKSRFQDELHIFVEWFLGGFLQQAPAAGLPAVFEALVANALAQPRCLIHRDYHCRNLLLDPKGRFGIVDFQDALIGPFTYDLACLLWDCYHYFDAAERRRWLRLYQEQAGFPSGADKASGGASPAPLPPAAQSGGQPATGASISSSTMQTSEPSIAARRGGRDGASISSSTTQTDPSAIQGGGQPSAGPTRFHSGGGWDEAALTRALDLTALQRQFKAVGIFARLWLRDGKQSHLRHIAPVLDAMREIAALYRETQPLLPWLERLAADAAKAVQQAQATVPAP